MQNKNSKDYKERGIFMIKVELKDGSIIEVEEKHFRCCKTNKPRVSSYGYGWKSRWRS